MNEFFSAFRRIRQSRTGKGTRVHRLVALLSVAAFIFGLSSCALSGSSRSSKNSVLGELMVERLEWMDEVACVKMARSLPVNDPVREAQLLDAMAALAVESKLPEERVRKFFSGQMEAAKRRQGECFKEVASPKHVPDLTKTIRPALDSIGRKMILALALARKSGESTQVIAEARLLLEGAGFSNTVIVPAIQGLEAGVSEK